MKKGCCYLVGTGPGDPGLVTLRALELVKRADVVIYDYLASGPLLEMIRPDAEKIYVGKKAGEHTLSQGRINELIVAKAGGGKSVVRLKGGDPYLFGRGGEEAMELARAGVPFEVVPGITAAMAASAYAGIPITHRDHASCVTFLTGHEDPAKPESNLDWAALVASKATLAIYMGMDRIRGIAEKLQNHGMAGDTPAAVVQWGTLPKQRAVYATVATLAEQCAAAGVGAPAIILIGRVVDLHGRLDWFRGRPLHGKRVVVTRTRKQASRLKKLLVEEGAEVLELPAIRIEEKADSRDWKAALPAHDWLVFTSPNAVEHFFGLFCAEHDLRELGPCRIAALGPATADKVREMRLRVDFQPVEFTAEALCQEWPFRGPGRVLYPCSDLAEDRVKILLEAKGWEVEGLPVYRTLPETEDPFGVRRDLRQNGADWIVFSSASAVRNFLGLKLNMDWDRCRIATLGPVTSAAVREAGLRVALEPGESRIEALVGAMAAFQTE